MGRVAVGLGPAGVPFLEQRDDGDAFTRFVRRAEALGYRAVCVGDHLDGRGGPFSSLAAAACSTTRLSLAAHVLSVELRSAPVLAQETRSLQILSRGRVELGLGVGWLQRDFDAAGIPMAPFADRLDRLATSVAAVRATFEHSTMPAPRIVIGGGGRRMLAAAAQLADIVTVNIPLRGSGGLAFNTVAAGTRELVEKRIQHVHASAAEAGRTVALHLYVHEVHVGRDWEAFVDRRAGALGMSTQDYVASPHVLVGDVDRIATLIEQRRNELGLDYISIPGGVLEDFAPVLECSA